MTEPCFEPATPCSKILPATDCAIWARRNKFFATQSQHLTSLQKKPFENIVEKRRKYFTQDFLLFHNVFYFIKDRIHHLATFEFGPVKNMSFGKKVRVNTDHKRLQFIGSTVHH